MKKLLSILILLFATTVSYSQTENWDTGTWTDLYVSKSVKNITVFGGAKYETRKNVTKTQEDRVYSGAIFKKDKWSLQAGYMWLKIYSPTRRTFFSEKRPTVMVSRKFQVSKDISISPKVRFEYRLLNTGNKERIVFGHTSEHKLSPKWKLGTNAEVFYTPGKRGTLDPTQWRKRLFVFGNVKLAKHLSQDLGVVYQHDQNTKFNNSKLSLYTSTKLTFGNDIQL